MSRKRADTSLAGLLRTWFTTHLKLERAVSENTVESYATTFRLLIKYWLEQRGQRRALTLDDLDATVVLAFLEHRGTERGWTATTRNARLAAVKSFFKYAAVHVPAVLPVAERVLAIPAKRSDEKLVGYLTLEEMNAVLGVSSGRSWSSRRDHALFTIAYSTGARVSELVNMRADEATLQGKQGTVMVHGKGRKERVAVLSPEATEVARRWKAELPPGAEFLFPNRRGCRMTRSGVQQRLRAAVATAAATCPSLLGRKVSPHVLRHTTAMHLLEGGVPLNAIALFLGHESIETTHKYVTASAEMKRKALERLPRLLGRRLARPEKTEALITFLEGLQRATPPTT